MCILYGQGKTKIWSSTDQRIPYMYLGSLLSSFSGLLVPTKASLGTRLVVSYVLALRPLFRTSDTTKQPRGTIALGPNAKTEPRSKGDTNLLAASYVRVKHISLQCWVLCNNCHRKCCFHIPQIVGRGGGGCPYQCVLPRVMHAWFYGCRLYQGQIHTITSRVNYLTLTHRNSGATYRGLVELIIHTLGVHWWVFTTPAITTHFCS